MTAAEVKARCDGLARDLERATWELNELIPPPRLRADERAAEEAIQHLGWASATCTMLGVHAGKPEEVPATAPEAQ